MDQSERRIHIGWEEDAHRLLQRLQQHWEATLHPDEVRQQLIELLLLVKRALARDSADARFVVAVYRRTLAHEADDDEQARANAALKRMLTELGVVVVSILPFAFVTLPGLFALARYFGIDLLPEEPSGTETAGEG